MSDGCSLSDKGHFFQLYHPVKTKSTSYRSSPSLSTGRFEMNRKINRGHSLLIILISRRAPNRSFTPYSVADQEQGMRFFFPALIKKRAKKIERKKQANQPTCMQGARTLTPSTNNKYNKLQTTKARKLDKMTIVDKKSIISAGEVAKS